MGSQWWTPQLARRVQGQIEACLTQLVGSDLEESRLFRAFSAPGSGQKLIGQDLPMFQWLLHHIEDQMREERERSGLNAGQRRTSLS